MSQLLVDDIVNKDDTGAPGFSKGVIVTGIITATSLSGNASGLTGTPNIVVNNITGVAVTFTGDLDVVGVSTFTSTINTDIVNDSRGFNVGTSTLSVARMGKTTDGSGYCNIRDSSGANGISLDGSSGSGTFGGSVKIGGTAASNEMDEYEEGTFTPVLTKWAGTPGDVVYTAQSGSYIKIGDIVHVQLTLAVSAGIDWSGTSNALTITGLPFTVGHNNIQIAWPGYFYYVNSSAQTFPTDFAWLQYGTSLYANTISTGNSWTTTFDGAASIKLGFTYSTASL